jgi:hypothetical protein
MVAPNIILVELAPKKHAGMAYDRVAIVGKSAEEVSCI